MAKMSPRAAERRSQAGKNPSSRQVETSMSKRYKGTPKVSQSTIDNIKKLGMSAALKKAGSSKNPEYLEGIRRMYGAARLKKAQSPAVKKAALSAKMSPRVVERTRPAIKKTSPRAVERGTAAAPKKKTAVSGYTPSAQFKAKQEMGARGRARLKGLFSGNSKAPATTRNQQRPGAQRSR